MTDRQPILSIQNISKTIGNRKIIDGLSLELHAGEICGFLGPNGAGKTTTIRMIVGLMKMDKGDVLIRGKSIRHQFCEAIKYVGAIVENPEMYKFMSGFDNLMHYARMTPGISPQRVLEVAEFVGLKQRIKDKVSGYSLGMRQRLGVAQAILHKPSVLILDEPTNGLDPAGIRELRDYLKVLAVEENIAVFVSSHLLAEMELMCDRIAIIQNGMLIDQMNLHERSLYHYELKVSDVERAITVLRPDWNVKVGPSGDHILFSGNNEGVAGLNRHLVSAGIDVYQIVQSRKSLEDLFLEKTGGMGIV